VSEVEDRAAAGADAILVVAARAREGAGGDCSD